MSFYPLDVSDFLQYSTGADNTPATYITYYFLSVMGLINGVVACMNFMSNRHRVPQENLQGFAVGGIATMALFLCVMIHAFTMGWLHEYYLHWDDSESFVFTRLW